MGLIKALFRLIGCRIHPPGKPYMPAPQRPQSYHNAQTHQFPGGSPNSSGAYTEIEADFQSIHGTNLKFGTEKIVVVDPGRTSRHITHQHSHLLGTGKLVTSLEDIQGVCKICYAIAMESYQAGEITLEQAQANLLFDTDSSETCDTCGLNGCRMHVRPMQTEQGDLSMCLTCQKELKKQLRRRQIVQLLLSPICEDEDAQA